MKHSTPLTRLKWILGLALLLLCTVGVVSAKYVTTIEKDPMTVTFSVKLAESVVLQEQTATRQDDGSYTLSAPMIQDGQTYELIPGLDIPKDPHVVITNKTDIPAYLYIEITDTLDTYEDTKVVTYNLTSDWRKTTESDQKHGENVYVYTGSGKSEAVKLDNTNTPIDPIYILANNKVTVSQHVKHADILQTADGTDDLDVITIYAYLVEAVD